MRPKVMDSAIVITGIGLACSLGIDTQAVWEGILGGRSAAAAMPQLESSPPSGASGYQAMDLPPSFFPAMQREARYLRWVLQAALRDAGMHSVAPVYSPYRQGIVLGTTLHGMRSTGRFLRNGNAQELQGFQASNVLREVLTQTPFAADAITTCSACSSSLGAVALGVTLLETNQADMVVVGGYDAVSEYAYGGFNSLRLVAEGALRPFARERQGMKLGEGYGLLVLERQDAAQQRNAPILARIRGFGESADAHHLTQPHPQGQGAAAAITAALRRAGLEPGDIDLVAAHATGTPDNDRSEYAALAAVFKEKLPQVPVVAFKSHIGHTLGGAGAVELIASLLALRHQVVPPCANVRPQDMEFADLNLATPPARPSALRTALNLSLGFGGANTCVIIDRPPTTTNAKRPSSAKRTDAEVFISGIGVVLPGAVGNNAFLLRLSEPSFVMQGAIDENQYIHLLNARRVRRMSDYVKLTLAATALACRDAQVEQDERFLRSCSALLGTSHGSSTYCQAYYGQIVTQGMVAANPMLFAEGVPNAAAAHLSMMLGLQGSCQTIIGSRTAGLDALRLASLRIASGQWDRAIVSAAEEFVPQVNQVYAHFRLYNDGTPLRPFGDATGFHSAAGAVTFILENRASLEGRNTRPYARLTASSAVRFDPGRAACALARMITALGPVDTVLGSANNTRTDRLEEGVLKRLRHTAKYTTLYGHCAELFSAGPLAAMAAVMLSGSVPDLLNTPTPAAQSFNRAAVICTGYSGSAAAVRIEKTPG